jgi:hypothetical protein
MKAEVNSSVGQNAVNTSAPFNFEYRHYVPILKTKQGELWALSNVKPARSPHLTPLLEVHQGKQGVTAAHVSKVIGAVKDAWGVRPLFLDTSLCGVAAPSAVANCRQILQAASTRGLNFVPVTSPSRSVQYQDVVAHFADRGVMVRLAPGSFADVATLRSQLSALATRVRLPFSKIDVLVDYESVRDSAVLVQLVRSHVATLPFLSQWRTVTIAGGSFPATLSDRTPHTWHTLPRHEWLAWLDAVTGTPQLLRLPSFGDYGVRDTQPPSEFGSPSANLRYTANESFLLRRHDVLVKNGGSAGIHAICASLRMRVEYSGQSFTAGDSQIYVRAATGPGPGNAGNWTAWGMSHHFGAVVDGIRNLPAA